jgi:N-acetyllactosaminide beta-1,3-N-acetylglucosaminyltransferase
MDYDYMILDNAFLVHKPGIKPPKKKKKKPDRAVRKQNRIYKKIAAELDKVYEKRDGCEL